MVAALGLNAEHVTLVQREISAAVPTTIHDRATVFSDFEIFNEDHDRLMLASLSACREDLANLS